MQKKMNSVVNIFLHTEIKIVVRLILFSLNGEIQLA